ncbi:MAG: thiamine pyrophosphate-binding protein [Vulcanimicrobiaceae bacterium]
MTTSIATSLSSAESAQEPKRLRGGVILAQALAKKKIQHVFTLSGGFINPVLEGLAESGISVMNTPHEQVAGHLADAWTRLTRQPAVCLVGPEGFANTVPAMLEAFGERSPVIFITGSSTLKRRGAGGFKEVDDVSIARPLMKLSLLVTDGHRIPEFIDKVYSTAVNGTPGPVHLSVPTDILYSSYDESAVWSERPYDYNPKPPRQAWPDPADLANLTGLVKRAQRPVLIVGSGVQWSDARNELSNVANRHGIPVLNAPYHPKILKGDDAALLGLSDVHLYPPASYAIENADLAIVLGCRFDSMLNFGNPPFFPKDLIIVTVNGSASELAENHGASVSVLGDPGVVLGELGKLLSRDGYTASYEWLRANVARRETWIATTLQTVSAQEKKLPTGKIHPLRLSLVLADLLTPRDCLVIDGGDTHYWAEIALLATRKKLDDVLHPGPYSLLGCGVPLALAAKMKEHDRNVVLLSGDGAFLSGGWAIEVAFEENLPITVVVDNNEGLGSIAQQQIRLFGTTFKTKFRDIPFHKVFEALGGYGEVVDKSENIAPAITRAIASGLPACVNVRSESIASPLIEALTDRRAKSSIE